jgi:CheY-like chemotaxis protein
LAFSRRQVFEPEMLDLNDQIQEVKYMLQRLIGEKVELSTKLTNDGQRILADPGQIDQVAINLVVNASDAMPQGGRLTIETDQVQIDEQNAPKHPHARMGQYVRMSVQDSGTGISVEILERIFEPFFTTKDSGKGTGLGLATVHGIVSQSGGYIDVESTPGEGTRFSVYFPLAGGEVEVKRQERTVPVDLEGTETILIVEDEEDVRVLIAQVLEHHGYRVLEARNCGEALLMSERREENIHLMLADVVMPQMNGPDLARRLKPLHPAMKALFMSGYLDETVSLQEGDSLLLKPFSEKILLEKLRTELDNEPAP